MKKLHFHFWKNNENAPICGAKSTGLYFQLYFYDNPNTILKDYILCSCKLCENCYNISNQLYIESESSKIMRVLDEEIEKPK